LGTTGLETAP